MLKEAITAVRFMRIGSQVVKVKLYLHCGFYFLLSKRDYDDILKTLNKKSLVGQEMSTVGDWSPCFNVGGIVTQLTVDDEHLYYCIATNRVMWSAYQSNLKSNTK